MLFQNFEKKAFQLNCSPNLQENDHFTHQNYFLHKVNVISDQK